jgi:hypothetical protein
MTLGKPNPSPRKVLLENLSVNPRSLPVALAFVVFLWTLGCLFFGIGLNNWNLVVSNIFYWIPEVLLILISTIYFLLGCLLSSFRQLMFREIYRLYGMSIMTLVTLDVGVRNASIGESENMTMFYYFSILISVVLMLNHPRNTMKKMEKARVNGWLKKQLDEKEWTWNPVYVNLDGPIAERKAVGKIKILEKLHYIMPGITSVISSIVGRTESFHVVGFVFIYLGIIFVGEVGRMSGILQQLKIWQIEEGKSLSFPIKRLDQ